MGSRSLVSYAEEIAFHAGWYSHYGYWDRLYLGMSGRSTYGRRGIRWYHMNYCLWSDVYIIDGSTCRRKRLVMLARIPYSSTWLLIVETKRLVCEEGPVHGKARCYADWVKVGEEVIGEDDAISILASYWEGALVHKDTYYHFQALKRALDRNIYV